MRCLLYIYSIERRTTMVLVTYCSETTMKEQPDHSYKINQEWEQEEFCVNPEELTKEMRDRIANGFIVNDVLMLSAYGEDLNIILKAFKGIPKPKVKDGKNITWYGDHAKFIFSNLVVKVSK